MTISTTGLAGAAALGLTLWSQQASAQTSMATDVYAPPPPTASVYSPAPSRDYPSLVMPSTSSRVTGYVDRSEACRGFDCLPTFEDRVHWVMLISVLATCVGLGALEIIRRHKDE